MSKSPGDRALIPQPFIDDVLNRTDLVELIESYLPLKKAGNSFVACCPFHSEKTPSFNVIAKKQFYHCFGCGSSGNAISFVMNYLNQGFLDALETLASRLGLTVPHATQTHKNKPSQDLYQLLEQVNHFYQQALKNQGHEAIAYLRQRGVTGAIAKRFQLGYASDAWHTLEHQFRQLKKGLISTGMLIQKDDGKTYDRYRQRIMFPIHDRHGRIIGFGGRALNNEHKPKYLNSPETPLFQKNRELYGLHLILSHNRNQESILIVEGYLDVIALAQFGINNAVATLGTATSSHHIQLLAKHSKQLLFCFDGDLAGKQAAWRALETSLPHLDNGLDLRFVFLPDGQDPDTFIRQAGVEAFKAQLKQAIPLNQYLLDTLSQALDLQNAAGKSQLVHACKPLLQQIPQGSYKELLLDELARITHIDNHRLRQLIETKASTSIVKAEDKPVKRSPLRLAVALLLQHPKLYESCRDAIQIESLKGRGQKILQTLLTQLAKNPEANTASLLELWRDDSLFDALTKLALLDLQIAEQDLTKTFIGLISFFQKQNLENKINEYIAKSKKQGLTDTERLLIQELLLQRHKSTDDKK